MLIFGSAIILSMIISLGHCQDSPCYTNWVYSKENGKCYIALNMEKNRETANDNCGKILREASEPKIIPRLPRIQKPEDILSLRNFLMSRDNNAPIWLDAKRHKVSSLLTWSDNSLVDLKLLQADNVSAECLMFVYSFKKIRTVYKIEYNVSGADCTSNITYVCEHDSLRCNEKLTNFLPETMYFVPNLTTISSYIFASCKPGFSRTSKSQLENLVQGSITTNYAYCTGNQHPQSYPSLYRPTWNYTLIEPCIQVECPVFNDTLNNVVSQIPQANLTSKTSFQYGHTFTVNCLRGYVSYSDSSMATAPIVCNQSATDKSKGFWDPISNTPCVAIQCNMKQLTEMIPINAAIQSARNKVTQQQYDVSLQTRLLPLYNNIITIQCKDGFFFQDRTWEKQVICDLRNDSQSVGEWTGYLGTSLPLYSSCQNATCKYEAILITPNLNIKPFFMMMNKIGVYVNQTQPSSDPYFYDSQLLFQCNDGFSTATGQSTQTLKCGPKGNWVPLLTTCITIILPLQVGLAQHYVPPPVEASSAQQIGCVAIVIMVVFLSMIVILDMSTLARDIKIMSNNIKNLNMAINSEKTKE